VTPVWVAAVTIGSFLPAEQKKRFGTQPYALHHPVATGHRVAHILTFGVTALLFLLPTDRPRSQALAVGAAFLLGCAIEVTQFAITFAPMLEWWDVRDDAIGIAGALLIFLVCRRALPKI